MGFNKRKWWYLGENKSITIEIAGWKSAPAISFRADPDERGVTFSISFGFAVYLSFDGFIPRSWYPTEPSTYEPGKRYPVERELSIRIHGGGLWWDFWVSEEWSSWTKNKTWRKGSFQYMDKLKGKHKYEREEVDRRQFLLPFLEGIYNVEVIQWARTDSYPRWPTRRMTTWEARAGYYDEKGEWKDKPIPVEGKGENSWDCDEDATWSMSFPGPPYNREVNTPYLAALYFWHSMMKSREQRGSAKWIPKSFKENKLSVIR